MTDNPHRPTFSHIERGSSAVVCHTYKLVGALPCANLRQKHPTHTQVGALDEARVKRDKRGDERHKANVARHHQITEERKKKSKFKPNKNVGKNTDRQTDTTIKKQWVFIQEDGNETQQHDDFYFTRSTDERFD